MSVVLSSKYQVVIPEKVRKSLNLKPGARIDVLAKGGVAYLVPVREIQEIKSILKGKLSKSDIQSLREKKDR